MQTIRLEDGSIKLLLEPLDGVLLGDSVVDTDGRSASLSSGNSVTGSANDDEEVHTVNSDIGVVLDTKIDVLVDTETEVTGLGEVSRSELVLLDLEASLENLVGLGASDGHVHGNLFVSSNGERSDGVSSLGVDGGLTRKLLEHLGGSSESITGLTNTNVEGELLDSELSHGVGGLVSLWLVGCPGVAKFQKSTSSRRFGGPRATGKRVIAPQTQLQSLPSSSRHFAVVASSLTIFVCRWLIRKKWQSFRVKRLGVVRYN